MVMIHPDKITLLHLAFPKPGRPVDERWCLHVLSCPKCMDDIVNMREMAQLMEEIRSEESTSDTENAGKGAPLYGEYGATAGASYGPAAAAATGTGGDSMMSLVEEYLDSDELGDVHFLDDEEEEHDVEPDVPESDAYSHE